MIVLGAVHKLLYLGGGVVTEKMKLDDTGRRGVIQKMTDDNDTSLRSNMVQTILIKP